MKVPALTLVLSLILYGTCCQARPPWILSIFNDCPSGCECLTGGAWRHTTEVICQQAHLTEIPVMRFAVKVKRLVLRKNAIKEVLKYQLDYMTDLESLDLRDNEISSLPATIFSDNSNLKYLDLSNNKIKSLPATIFSHNPNLKEINLSLNPFLCDCNLQSFSDVLHSYRNSGSVVIKDAEIMQCAAPTTFAARPVLNIMFHNERYNKQRPSEVMYIGETDSRGVAICPRIAKFEKLTQEAPEATTTTKAHPTVRKSSPNVALIVACVMAAVLVSCTALATGIKYFLKKMRSQSLPWQQTATQGPQRQVESFSEKLRQQRRASQGYPVSDCSSDEAVRSPTPKQNTSNTTTYFKEKLQKQRRHSRGYTRMHSSKGSASDLEDIELE